MYFINEYIYICIYIKFKIISDLSNNIYIDFIPQEIGSFSELRDLYVYIYIILLLCFKMLIFTMYFIFYIKYLLEI